MQGASASWQPVLPLHAREGTNTDLHKFFEERFGLLQVSGVKALGKPVVDLRQQLPGRGAFTLALPQAAQAHGGPQLERLRLLAAGNL